jgi:tRNA (adenine22-N1)-methyltransferase
LAAIAEFVRVGASVCDVGTDHAFLPCYLAKRGWENLYASDINENPLNYARTRIKKYGFSDKITAVKSDGLLDVPPCEDVVIAGMGGELIAEIVAKIPFKNENLRLILQPMTRIGDLRSGLEQSGFEIMTEKTAREKNRTYTVIYAKYSGKSPPAKSEEVIPLCKGAKP